MSRGELAPVQAAYQAALEPVGPKGCAVLLVRLFDFARAFNLPANAATMTPIYLDALCDLPPDLLHGAISDAVATWKWHNAMPTPAELRAPVLAELGRRKVELGRLKLAMQRLPAKPRDRSNPADQAAATEAFAAMRAALATAPIRAMERRADDDRPPTDPVEAAKRGRATLTGLTLEQRIQRAQVGG